MDDKQQSQRHSFRDLAMATNSTLVVESAVLYSPVLIALGDGTME